MELSPRGIPEWDWGKFYPGGTVQAKVMDGRMAEKMQFWAAMGHPSGPDFLAAEYLKAHPENEWMRGHHAGDFPSSSTRPSRNFAAIEAITDESTPPEMSTPYGTSHMSWRRTAASSAPRNFAGSYSSPGTKPSSIHFGS